jgi:hypothetical protein
MLTVVTLKADKASLQHLIKTLLTDARHCTASANHPGRH